MTVLISLNAETFIIINGLLPIGPSVMLLPVWCIKHHTCHRWRIHFVRAVVIRSNDEVGLKDKASLMDEANLMDEASFSSSLLLLLF